MTSAEAAIDIKEMFAAEDQPLEKFVELRKSVHCSIERRSELEKVLEDFASIAKKLSSENKAEVRRALALWVLGKVEDAVPVLQAARSSKERSFFLGVSLLDLGRPVEAAANLKEALDAESDNPMIGAALAEAELKSGNADGAKTRIERLLKKAPESADVKYVEGLQCDLSGDRSGAVEAYEAALKLEPEHARSMFRLAYTYDLVGDDDAALELYEQLRKLRPIHVNTLLNLGVIYEDRGQFDRALECYRAVLDYFPMHPRARLYFSDANASLNMYYDEDAAKRELKMQAVLMQPLAEISFSQRVRNAIGKMTIVTIGDLAAKTEEELLEIPNFGKTSLTEVREFLASKGLALATTKGGGATPVLAPAAPGIASPDVASKQLGEFEWSGRIRKAYEKLGVNTVGDLLKHSEADLTKVGLGATSLKEVRKKLGNLGVQMRTE